MSIYVGNLSYLPIDRETGRVRGFGFVKMESDVEQTAAIEALDNANSNEGGGGYSRRY